MPETIKTKWLLKWLHERLEPSDGQTGIALSYEDDISTTDIEAGKYHVIEVKIPE
ncbi:hypothetical protein [Paenibacillus gallinarum]|uniref:hypothetical protein n=1 Tax=Paenibacillus gallinarum TaxID=2762232 RepID=UPI00177F18F5|nr:hypothetical protein [Paenibacillus gallinarum]